MSLIIKKEPGNFTPHPVTENPVLGVIVDITPVKEVDRTDKKTGEIYKKKVFRFVYETEVTRSSELQRLKAITSKDVSQQIAELEGLIAEKGDARYCVWSRPYSADGRDPLNEKAYLRIDLKKILGRDLTAAELEQGFDVEASLMGRVVKLMVDHEESEGKTYDQIAMLKAAPDAKFAPSGSYIRQKDRKKDGDASYNKAETPAPSKAPAAAASSPKPETAAAAPAGAAPAAAPVLWENTKLHLEGYEGLVLADLDEETLTKLVQVELPKLEAKEKKTIADKRVVTALGCLKAELGI
jgi:hypothetical protein